MHLQNAMIEEVVFSPRLIPLSMKEPMRKICCGARFVLALTQVIFIFILKLAYYYLL
jgi:hypothetical protein